MTSFMIVRLPAHSKSLKAVEFMQENGFCYRLSSNVPLMEFLMSSGGGDSQLSSIISPSEKFELGKEEIRVISEMTDIFSAVNKVDVDASENSPPIERVIKQEEFFESAQSNGQNDRLEENSIGVQTEEPVEAPMVASKDPSPSVVTNVGQVEDESFSEIHGDLPLPVVEQGVQRVWTEPPLEEVQQEPEEREEQDSLGEKDGEGDEQQMEVGEIRDMTLGGPNEATGPDGSIIRQPSLHEPAANDVNFEEDLRIGDVRVIRDFNEDSDEDVEDDENMEESDDEEEELIEEQEHAAESKKVELVDESSDGDVMDEEEELDSDEEKDSDAVGNESSEEDEEAKETQKKKEVQKNKMRDRPSANPVGRLLYACPVKKCPSSFNTMKKLEAHMRIHPGKQDFFCDVCKKSFCSKDEAIAHIRERENKKCCGCGKTNRDATNLRLHLRFHTKEKPFVCKTCEQRFSQSCTLKRHRLTHTGEKLFSCLLCEKSFTTKQILKNHQRTHTGEKPFKCSQCDYRTAYKHKLKSHNLVHTGERPFECTQCGSRFSDRTTLRGHILMHSGQKPFSCKNCDKKFTRNYHLKTHMKRKHQTEES